MKKQSFIVAATIALYAISSRAETRGFLFRLGEKLLNLSGYSYVELEKRNQELVKSNETSKQKSAPSPVSIKPESAVCGKEIEMYQQKEKDLKDCTEYAKFKGTLEERTIGFPVSEILKAGCKGKLKYTKFENDGESPNLKQLPEVLTDVEVLVDKRWRMVVVREIKKVVEETRMGSNYQEFRVYPIDHNLDSRSVYFPPIALGRIYEIDTSNSGGTLEKGKYKIKYNVIENESKELEIYFNGEVSEIYNHMNLAYKYNYTLTCKGKSLAELNAMSEKIKAEKAVLKKKLMGE